MVTTVQELINYPFSQRSFEEQLKIIAEGPPRPRILYREAVELCPIKVQNGGVCEIEMWVCGCDVRNALICWTCLLFTEESQKIVYGFFPDKFLYQNLRNHKTSSDHVYGMLQFQILQSKMFHTPQNTGVEEFFEKNRKVLEMITDTVCMVLLRTYPETIREDYLNFQSQCLKLLNFFKISECPDIAEACNLLQRIPNLVSDILSSLASLVKKEFKKEMKSSSFLSIVLSGHVEVHTDLKLSIVVRYLKDGEVCERLIGFSSINKYLMDVVELVRKVINELEISEKHFAISCDGVVLPTHLLRDFFSWLYTYHPKSFFVPCHFHEFHSVLQQTLSTTFSECRVFFRSLRSMKDYLVNKDHAGSIRRFGKKLVIDFKKVKLSDAQFLRAIKLKRTDMISFFRTVADECSSNAKFKGFEALGFHKWLQEFHNVFLLELFFALFEKTAFVNEMLSSNSPDSAFECGVLDSTLDSLRRFRQDDFEGTFSRTHPDSWKIKAGQRHVWQRLFEKIVLHVIETIELRFRGAKSLNFLGILDLGTRDTFTVSEYHLSNLSKMEYQLIPVHELSAEVKVMREHGWLTGKNSVYEIVGFLHQNNLHRTFKNLFRLAEFIVSLPCKPLCLSSPQTKLDSINAWTSCLYIPRSESLTLVCEENKCLENLKMRTNFQEEVVSELRTLCENTMYAINQSSEK